MNFKSDSQRRAVMSKFSKNNRFALYYSPGYESDKNYKRVFSDEYPSVDFILHNLSDRVKNKSVMDKLSNIDESHLAGLGGVLVVPAESDYLGKRGRFGFYNVRTKDIVVPDRGVFDAGFPTETIAHEVGHHISYTMPKSASESFAKTYQYNVHGDSGYYDNFNVTPKILEKVAYVESIHEAANPSIKQQMKYAGVSDEV